MELGQDQDDVGDEGRDDLCGGSVHVRAYDLGEEWDCDAGKEDDEIHDEQPGVDRGVVKEV